MIGRAIARNRDGGERFQGEVADAVSADFDLDGAKLIRAHLVDVEIDARFVDHEFGGQVCHLAAGGTHPEQLAVFEVGGEGAGIGGDLAGLVHLAVAVVVQLVVVGDLGRHQHFVARHVHVDRLCARIAFIDRQQDGYAGDSGVGALIAVQVEVELLEGGIFLVDGELRHALFLHEVFLNRALVIQHHDPYQEFLVRVRAAELLDDGGEFGQPVIDVLECERA